MTTCILTSSLFVFFFFNDTATTEIYTLSLHDALPILPYQWLNRKKPMPWVALVRLDRKSTRLTSSHPSISYAVFCLKKKNHTHTDPTVGSRTYKPQLSLKHKSKL